MNKPQALEAALKPLALGDWQYYPEVGSTNDLALEWARKGAPDWSLAVADEQTAGRGRADRGWVTRPGVSLAMSLVMRPSPREAMHITRFTALAALGLVQALAKMGLPAEIKWPNDVLLKGKKVAGVLVEAEWRGDGMDALVVGMGVNIKPDAVPDPAEVRFPSTSVEEAAGHAVDRWVLLADILHCMQQSRSFLSEEAFMADWNAHLAFREEWVLFRLPSGVVKRLLILGVMPDGWLSLKDMDGQSAAFTSGEIAMVYT